jgi:hypothetical protein
MCSEIVEMLVGNSCFEFGSFWQFRKYMTGSFGSRVVW